MAKYIDGFVLVVPKKNLNRYRKMAKLGAKVWKKHGALEYVESIGDDMAMPWGLAFPKLTKAKPSDVVVFSYVIYKSKTDRNRIVKKVMADPELTKSMEMPFDMKKMSYGGFKVIVEK